MAEPTITRGEDYFFTTIYEGTGFGQKVGNFVPFTDSGTIAKSCLFNETDSPYLEKTYSGNGSRTTWTISFWIKLGKIPSYNTTRANMLIAYNTSSGAQEDFRLEGSNQQLQWYTHNDGGTGTLADLKTTRTFEDTSKWYHMMFVADRTNATAADRQIIYIDGERVTAYATASYPSQSAEGHIGKSADVHYIGSRAGNSSTRFDGYLAEFNYVDGTALTPSTFGLTDTSTGRWIPKTLSGITYGQNGVRMQYANTAGQTIGDDTSGNGNDYTVSNLTASDITTDSPTQNHMTMGGRRGSNITLSEGNLRCTVGPSDTQVLSNFGLPPSGKWYWEITLTTLNTYGRIGVSPEDASTSLHPLTQGMGYDRPETANGVRIKNVDIGSGWDGAFTQGNIVNFALDADNKFLYIGENNTWRNSGDPTSGATGTGGIPYGEQDFANKKLHPSMGSGNSGGTKVYDFNFGQKGFAYTPPSGYSAPQQDNFPETNKGTADLVWIKNRDSTDHHYLADSSRGPGEFFRTSTINTLLNQTGDADGIVKFLKSGVEVEDGDEVNAVNESYVSWNWVGNGGTEVANTDGSGATIASTHQVNTTSGLSIIQWAGTGTSGYINHGLSTAPAFGFAINKNRSDGTGMVGLVYHKYYGYTKYGVINQTVSNMFYDASVGNNWNYASGFTNSNITVGTNVGINSSGDFIGWFWAEVDGFSKAGSYVGNGNTDGPYVYTGFKPAFVLRTRGDTANTRWTINDNVRTPINTDTADGGPSLFPDSNQVEQSTSSNDKIDFLSNGFKVRGSNTASNAGGGIYVYMAFAEHPFIGSGSKSPATAR